MEEIGHIHIAGCGDIGRRVGRLCLDKQLIVSGTVQSQASEQLAKAAGINASCADLETQALDIAMKFNKARFSIFYFAPPPSHGLIDTRLGAFLAALSSYTPQKVVLISTTGVYGDCQGQWVDETAPLQPIADRAHRRVDAENKLKHWCQTNKVKYMILRVPGIYAKERLPLKRLQSCKPVVCSAQAPWTNRIHADDLAQTCLLAMAASANNETLNICDDRPSTMTDYFNTVADFAKLKRPPQIPLEIAMKTLSSGMQSYLQESRRIRNNKMKSVLGIQLKYPDLKAGLAI